jgi:hypothetical protein
MGQFILHQSEQGERRCAATICPTAALKKREAQGPAMPLQPSLARIPRLVEG